ncbi:hypothetical protein ES703_69827 [subsurface metagenome]
MIAAIYCRVSTKGQKDEGSSLESQREACLKLASERGYDVPHIFEEDWTGATLDRPRLNQVRSLIREKAIDAVICYATDRLARNPIHIAIIAEECDKKGIELIFVTEPLDNSPEGQLIRYVKGYAAQMEREKIADRTMRGRKSRALAGKLPTGGLNLYGYVYDPATGKRRINEYEAGVVRLMFKWLVEDRVSCNEICRRLIANNIPAPKGGSRWGRTTVGRILRNPDYYGETYANKMLCVEPKTVTGNKRYKKTRRELRPREEWIELQDATPPIITQELFDQAQQQLQSNRAMAPRQQKHQYLLRGLILCKWCGRRYHGEPEHGYTYYRCSGRNKLASYCRNQRLRANYLEELVWGKVKEVLVKPELLIAELERMRQSNTQAQHLEDEVRLNQQRLETLDDAETRVTRIYVYAGGDIDKTTRELKRIRAEQDKIKEDIAKLEKRIEQAKQVELNEAGIKRFCELARQNIENFTFDEKRLALETLQIKVWIDGVFTTIEGLIPVLDSEGLSAHS